MSAIPISAVVTLIEEHAHAVRVTEADYAVAHASMDLNAPKILDAHQRSVAALRSFCQAFIQATTPPADANGNGRLKLAS